MGDLLKPESGDIFGDAPSHTVYTRERWGQAWQEQEHLYAVMARQGSGPVKSLAELEWRYGIGKPPGKDAFAIYAKKELLGHYVKIKIDQDPPLFWYGLITEIADQPEGCAWTTGADPQRLPAGRQRVFAEGLELLLQRTFMDSAWIQKTVNQEIEIHRGLNFNDPDKKEPNEFASTANRALQRSPIGIYTFVWDLEAGATWWSSRYILEYLLEYHAPKDAMGWEKIKWRLSDRAKTILPEWDRPVVRAAGRDLWSIINEVCDRRRLLSWQITVEAEPDPPGSPPELYLDVFSFVGGPHLVLPSGEIQLGNRETVSLDFDTAVDVTASLKDSDVHRVEQVVVRGARKRACFSLSYLDGTLVADWAAADETAYEAGPAGIGGLDRDKQERRVREFRASDQYERVYSYFRTPANWDGKVGDGVGGTKTYLAPEDPEFGKEELYFAELRFERFLPPSITVDPGASPKAGIPPLAIIKTEADGSETDRYCPLERLAVAGQIEGTGDGAGRKWSASLRVQEGVPGVIVKVHGGPQHLIAKTDFTPLDVDEPGQLDWRDNLIVTVMAQLDSYVEVRYPRQLIPTLDVARKVYIDLGKRARLDWVHAGTINLTDDGEPQYAGYGAKYIRDDRPMMEDLARFLFEWYAVTRQAFTFQFKRLSGLLRIGNYIEKIGADETEQSVNAVVTGVEWDLRACATRVTTAFAELDPLQLV